MILDSTRVLLYAETGGATTYTGRLTIARGYANDLRDIGPVPKLAICEDLATGQVLVMHCDSVWNVLGVHFAASVDDAKANAERAYAGVGSRWTEYRTLSEDELAEVEEERQVLRQLARDYPLDGHNPDAA